jgi:hypothetical protein
VKINNLTFTPVVATSKPLSPQAVTAASSAIERQNMREDARKQKVSRSMRNSETPASPAFSSLIARELSHRLASEAHDHEESSSEESTSEEKNSQKNSEGEEPNEKEPSSE